MLPIARIRNLTNANGRPWANQINITFKLPDGDELEMLQSYDAKVALIDRNTTPKHITLGDKWNYSQTTIRAVCKFLEDFTGSKWTKKEIDDALENEVFTIYDKATGKAPYWEMHHGADCYFDDFLQN